MILVDSSVLIDVLKGDARWGAWSTGALQAAKSGDAVRINDVVYSEISFGYAGYEELDAVLRILGIDIAPASRAALFLAARAFQLYRRRGGVRTGVLPDFFIGAQAAVESAALLTRDPDLVHTYFPTVTLIAP